MKNPRIGDVYYMRFDGDGHEQRGIRPAIVFQNNRGNIHSPNTIAIPLTTSIKKIEMPTHVLIHRYDSGLSRDSIALCECAQEISKEKILWFVTTLSREYMAKIAEASILASCGISFIDKEALNRIWNRARKINTV